MYISALGCFFIGIGVGFITSMVALVVAAISIQSKRGK
jgi:hypothetical protein